jgi:hypothetical protein
MSQATMNLVSVRPDSSRNGSSASFACLVFSVCLFVCPQRLPAELRGALAKVDITDYSAGPVHVPMFARVLVLQQQDVRLVLVGVDAVAIGEIGRISNEYLPRVRTRLEQELGLPPEGIIINASHCHGVIRTDLEDLTVRAVHEAWGRLEPVRIGVGIGEEREISENRRLLLKDGRTADARHAYPLPANDAVAEVGPIDPEIGVLRIDRLDGSPLGVVYHFACHPIMGVPGGANTADFTGVSSRILEEQLGAGTVALFLQGCGGDINPRGYKEVHLPRRADPLGMRLALSTLQAYRAIETSTAAPLLRVQRVLELPRADHADRIARLEAEQRRLMQSLKGTSLNLQTYLALMVKYQLDPDHPSGYASAYLQETAAGAGELVAHDAENRKLLQDYTANILAMEELTRVQTNLNLLRKHQAGLVASGKRTVRAEVQGVRIGPAVLLTFPGELTVPIGLKIKQRSPVPQTFVSGYTNGYLYYAGTAEQLLNPGWAQEDCDCLLAPEWEEEFHRAVDDLLSQLR